MKNATWQRPISARECSGTDRPVTCSVIVCTRNRAALLKRLLASLTRQTLPLSLFEVIVVDDASSDDTAAVAQACREGLPGLKYLRLQSHSGLAVAANLGIAAAGGKLLLFTDDDCIPNERWAESIAATLQRSEIVAGAIASPKGNRFTLLHNIAQFHPFLEGRAARGIGFIAGANMGFRRSVWEDVGPFCAGFPLPDMEWILRAREKGYKIDFAPAAVITHDPPRCDWDAIVHYSATHASHSIGLRLKHRNLLATPLVLRHRFLLLAAAPLVALFTTTRIFLANRQLWRFCRLAPQLFWLKFVWCLGAARGLRQIHDRSSRPALRGSI